jgi:hypothetical protein
VLVIVVPMLAPIMIGTAPCTVIEPEATNATSIDVVVELLCNTAVTRRPMNSPLNGFIVASPMTSLSPEPILYREATINLIAKTKSTNVPISDSAIRKPSRVPAGGISLFNLSDSAFNLMSFKGNRTRNLLQILKIRT